MNINENFEMLLDKDEEIKWSNGTNVSAYVKKNFLKTFLLGLFPPIAVFMLGIPYSWLILILSLTQEIPIWIGILHFLFSIVMCGIYITILNKSAKNTFFCITNKRIIVRSGVFRNDFKHFSLKNIGNVQVNGSIFDSKGNNPSANLNIICKNFHTNTSSNSSVILRIDSLNNAYEAYKLISKVIEGNNESLRVKIEK